MENGIREDLETRLITSCRQGDVETAQQILDNDCFTKSIDFGIGEGYTLLQLAAAGGHEDVVRLLLVRGATLEGRNSYGWTPLMQAASYGHVLIVALLLQNKVDPNAKNKLGASALTLAALGGHLSVVRVLLDHPGLDLNDCQDSGQSLTPVMAAAACGYRSILKLLIQRGSAQSQLERSTGWTVLMMASLGGSHGSAEMLLRTGADPNTTDINQRTALEIAVMQDHGRVGKLLDKKTTNRTGVAGLEKTGRIFKAIKSGDASVVRQLLTEDSHQCNMTSREGAMPLMVAAMLGHRVISEILVKKGADINHQDRKSGWTALMQATFHRQREVVKYLLEAGADSSIQANDGCSALDLALLIVNSDTDKVGDELIQLLASQEELTAHNLIISGQSRITAEEDFLKGGLKAWWFRMSNRFQNLKLTRTLRAGFISSKVTAIGAEDIDATLYASKDSHQHSSINGNKTNKSVEFNLGGDTKRHDGGTHTPTALNMQPTAFTQAYPSMPMVIPPFSPAHDFKLKKTDGLRQTSNSSTLRNSVSGQIPYHEQRKHRAPNRLSFTRRSSTTQPIHTSHSKKTTSTVPTPNSDRLKNGSVPSGSIGSLPSRCNVTTAVTSGTARNMAWTATGDAKASDELSRYQKNAERLGSASSTSSTLSGSTKNPTECNPRRIKGEPGSNSTLTPPTSPIMVNNGCSDGKTKDIIATIEDSPSKLDELTTLLGRLSLGRYADTFKDQEVDMDAFLTLSDQDLLEMGIVAPEDRHQLLEAIKRLSEQPGAR